MTVGTVSWGSVMFLGTAGCTPRHLRPYRKAVHTSNSCASEPAAVCTAVARVVRLRTLHFSAFSVRERHGMEKYYF